MKFKMFTISTQAEDLDRMDPICIGLSSSVVGVTEALSEDDVVNAAGEAERHNDIPMKDLVESHGEVWVIATCYEGDVAKLIMDAVWPLLIDTNVDADDPRRLKPCHISTLRKAAHEVIVGANRVRTANEE